MKGEKQMKKLKCPKCGKEFSKGYNKKK